MDHTRVVWLLLSRACPPQGLSMFPAGKGGMNIQGQIPRRLWQRLPGGCKGWARPTQLPHWQPRSLHPPPRCLKEVLSLFPIPVPMEAPRGMCFVLLLAASASAQGALGEGEFRGVWLPSLGTGTEQRPLGGSPCPGHGRRHHGGPQIPVTALLVLTRPVSVTSGCASCCPEGVVWSRSGWGRGLSSMNLRCRVVSCAPLIPRVFIFPLFQV